MHAARQPRSWLIFDVGQNMASPPASVHNQALWQKHRRRVGALAQRIITGEVGVIDGARQMLKFQVWLHATSDADFKIFAGVDSESHHLPIGEVRKHWTAEALKKKDEEITALEDFYRDQVVKAAAQIRAKYE